MEKVMKAAILYAPGDLRIENISIPKLKKGEVLIKVSFCGLCGSDIPRILVNGTYHFPTIPGHEFGGVIVEAFDKADRNLIGKKAAVIPLIPCKKCEMCEIGSFAQCKKYDFLGSRSNGGFAQYVKVPVENLVILPDDMDNLSVAFLEPISVALHVIRNSGLNYGKNVAVFGLGAIGMFIAQWAKIFGAKHVFAIDIDSEKVDLAKKIGFKEAICIKDINIEKYINNLTDGVDFVFEASGSMEAFRQGIKILRQSGRLGLVGRPTKDIILKPEDFEKILRSQLKIIGTWSFEMKNFPSNDWKESMEAIYTGKIKIKELVSHIYELEKISKAIDIMKNHTESFTKILISPN